MIKTRQFVLSIDNSKIEMKKTSPILLHYEDVINYEPKIRI